MMKRGDSSTSSNLNKLFYKFWRNAKRCLAAVQLLKLRDVFMALIPQRASELFMSSDDPTVSFPMGRHGERSCRQTVDASFDSFGIRF